MFKVGQKVVCVKEPISGSVKKGKIYTVKDVGFNYEYWVRLEEAIPYGKYKNFSAWRFREIDEAFATEVLEQIKEQIEEEQLIEELTNI